MKINKFLLLVSLIIIFLSGLLLGFYINNIQSGGESINLNPFPKSCYHNGRIYKSGESFPAGDGCNSCTCENGTAPCTLMGCE